MARKARSPFGFEVVGQFEFQSALVRKHNASEIGEYEHLHKDNAPLLAAFVHAEGARQLRGIAPQKMSRTPYADALRLLQPEFQRVEDSLEEREYAGLGLLGTTFNDDTGEEERGQSPRDLTFLDHVHMMREFVVSLWEALAGVMANGWYDEEDERQFDVPGHVGGVWTNQPLWFERC